MASYYSWWVATDDWRIRADVSVSTSNTAATYTVALYLENRYANVRNTPFYGSVTIAGTASNWNRTGVYPGNTYHLGTATKTVNKGTTSQTVAISFRGYFGSGSSSAAYRNGTSGTANQTLAAKPSYTVSYNANGGSGAPGNQTKWYGVTLKLSSTKPSRTGYSFQGWATSSGGSVAYASGANYTGNAALTLYAVWKANTYAVKYNANGGTGAPGQQTKTYGVTLKLSSTKPTRTNYNFKGWATSATGAVAYQPGANYTANAAVTLYAVWQLAYVAPRISNLAANRCNSAGTLAEDGQYAKVTFNWATDRTVSGIKIVCNGVTTNVSGSGTSGSVSQVVGANALSTENQYSVTVTVSDSGGSSSQNTTVAPLAYIMDFAPNGSVAIGEPANGSTREFSVATPIVMKDYMRGLHGNGNFSEWRYKILARGSMQNTSNGSCGHIRIFGVLGGWTGTSKGPIDIHIPTRGGSETTIVVSSFSPVLFNNNSARLMVRLGSDGYVYAILAAYQYYSYNLFIDGEQIEVLDTDWSTSTGVSGTDWFNSTTVETSQFGGYPAKLENLNGFYGMTLPNKTRSDWIRTTSSGLIPYQSGTPAPSALGTASWTFKEAWVNALNWTGSGLRGMVMKQLWSGTWSSGSISAPELPKYNTIMVDALYYGHTFRVPAYRCKSDSGGVIFVGGSNTHDTNGLCAFAIKMTLASNGTTLSGSPPGKALAPSIGFEAKLTVKVIYGLL